MVQEKKLFDLKGIFNSIREVEDWPKKGISFKDITTLLQNSDKLKETCNILFDRYHSKGITKVVGIDARGFIFGSILAYLLGVGFIPIRKKGKLPYKTFSETYSLEYGTDTLCIHQDALVAEDSVLIIDDLLATGGTARASLNLVHRFECRVIEMGFIIELPNLGGRDLIENVDVFSIVKFGGV